MAAPTATASADVSSASAKAIAAATSTKSRPSPLPTPQSATFPSSLQTPGMTPGFLQAERNRANMKTPITPPPAYLDFLRNVDAKGLRTPLATSKSANFSFSEAQRSPYPWPRQPASARLASGAQDPPASRTSRVPSPPTTAPIIATNGNNSLIRRASDGSEPTSASQVHLPTVLPSHSKPNQPVRRPSVVIPESPSQPSFSAMSPPTAHVSKARSPLTANAARDYYMNISPDGTTPRSASAPALGKQTYTVRHVITRTVTYTRPVPSPGAYAGHLAPNSRPTSSGSRDSRERTPKEDVMKLDSILNSTTDEPDSGQKRKPEVKAEEPEKEQEDERSPVEQLVDARTTSTGPGSMPLVGEVPSGKRRKVA